MTQFGSLEVDRDLLASLEARYGRRPERLEQVVANAVAWVRLKARVSEPSPADSREVR